MFQVYFSLFPWWINQQISKPLFFQTLCVTMPLCNFKFKLRFSISPGGKLKVVVHSTSSSRFRVFTLSVYISYNYSIFTPLAFKCLCAEVVWKNTPLRWQSISPYVYCLQRLNWREGGTIWRANQSWRCDVLNHHYSKVSFWIGHDFILKCSRNLSLTFLLILKETSLSRLLVNLCFCCTFLHFKKLLAFC